MMAAAAQEELPSLEDIGRSMSLMDAEIALEQLGGREGAPERLAASRRTSVAPDSPPGSPGARPQRDTARQAGRALTDRRAGRRRAPLQMREAPRRRSLHAASLGQRRGLRCRGGAHAGGGRRASGGGWSAGHAARR